VFGCIVRRGQPESFAAEGDERVDLRRAVRGDPRCQQSDRCQHNWCRDKYERICGGDAEQQVRYDAAESEGDDQADPDPEACCSHDLAEHESENLKSARSERNADTQFIRPPCDPIRRDALDADTREEDGDEAEQG
jgi:hypothetical protein